MAGQCSDFASKHDLRSLSSPYWCDNHPRLQNNPGPCRQAYVTVPMGSRSGWVACEYDDESQRCVPSIHVTYGCE